MLFLRHRKLSHLLVLAPSVVLGFTPSHDPCIGKPPAFIDAEVVKTAKTRVESAVLEEWERMSELERRIEDGMYYEHELQSPRRQQRKEYATPKDDADAAKGIFCGYRTTDEDYSRLRSADPRERSPYM